MKKNLAVSIRARLLERAKARGEDFNFTLYAVESLAAVDECDGVLIPQVSYQQHDRSGRAGQGVLGYMVRNCSRS